MGCRIIAGTQNGSSVEGVVLYCSNTMVAFGPVMGSQEEAEKFCEWIPGDPRSYSHQDLMGKYNEFVMLYVCECGAVRDDDCPNCKDGVALENGMHVVDGEKYRCYLDPAPAAGQRFECPSCTKRRLEKETKRKAGRR